MAVTMAVSYFKIRPNKLLHDLYKVTFFTKLKLSTTFSLSSVTVTILSVTLRTLFK